MQMDMAMDRRRTNQVFTALRRVCPMPALRPADTIRTNTARKTQ